MNSVDLIINKSKQIYFKQNVALNKMMYLSIPDADIEISYHDLIQILIENKSKNNNNRNDLSNNNTEGNYLSNNTEELIDETLSINDLSEIEDDDSFSDLSSTTSSDYIDVSGKMKNKNEPEDYYFSLSDVELIREVNKLLKDAKKYDIQGFFFKNKLEHKRFSLSGLYSSKYGIKSDKQRFAIRELCRICERYICSNYVKDKRNNLRQKLEKQEMLLDKLHPKKPK